MSVIGQNRPVYIKTYGRQLRKVEQWFSPDLRKKAFSFSSTPSSDQSTAEPIPAKKRRGKIKSSNETRTLRLAKKKALKSLKELESDEENVFVPGSTFRRQQSTKATSRSTAVKKPQGPIPEQPVLPLRAPSQQTHGQKRQITFSSSENEADSFVTKKQYQPNKRQQSTNATSRSTAVKKPQGPIPEQPVLPLRAPSQRTHGQKRQITFSSSENEADSFVTKKQYQPNKSEASAGKPSLGRFVTQRRRVARTGSDKQTRNTSSFDFRVPSNIRKTSKDVPSIRQNLTRHTRPNVQKIWMDNSDTRSPVASCSIQGRSVLDEVSLNSIEEQKISSQPPLLSSTPSLASRENLRYYEPSVIEISSFSCDELDRLSKNESTHSELMMKRHKLITSCNRKPCSESIQEKEGVVEEHTMNTQRQNLGNSQLLRETQEHTADCESDLNGKKKKVSSRLRTCKTNWKNPGAGVVSGKKHQRSRVDQSKERCPSFITDKSQDEVSHSIPLHHKEHSNQKMNSLRFPSELSTSESCQSKPAVSSYALSNSFPKLLYLSASSSQSTPSSSSMPVLPVSLSSCASNSVQVLIDRLKIECLSSCLTVNIQCLDQSQERLNKPQTPETATHQASRKYSNDSELQNSPPLLHSEVLSSHFEPSRPEWQPEGLVQNPPDSSMPPALSPAPIRASSKASVPVVPKERHCSGTSRKACVSGLSASRWSKQSFGERNRKRQKDGNSIWTKSGDLSLCYLLPAGAKKDTVDNKVIGLPVTPARPENLNISSILANFTPDLLTTHTWGRLKAALSIHKKKTAFPTPRRLALSNLRSPTAVNTSLDLFGTPKSRFAASPQLGSTVPNTPMSCYGDDISDAEKVYQECQQDGPLSFEECIPPERMKCCVKIGEGTFGEVFSTVNNSKETVALKIIPIEGLQKVNDETQKTFGEILHEIIISKELSMLETKESNRTSGFIGLNNLHCVQGCYPSALLKAWDKFDKEKGSENDRPDFFDKDQLFVILEFEFGGSDLENMNGKISSLDKAKSILHQVTAALAVAEQALYFEHRDLHWGNILVKTSKEKQNHFILNGKEYSVETQGVHINIIDYSLSRLEIDGLTVSCDISNDEELFMGKGDYQFEVYRLMKTENNNSWGEYNPHTNVLWLHYLVDKLLNIKYKKKLNPSRQKLLRSSLRSFHSEILSFQSATDALMRCSLFK